MKVRWSRKLCAAVTMSLLLGATSTGVVANTNTKMVQSDVEEVLVDIIGDNQRSTLFNDSWKFHRGEVKGAQNVDLNDSSWDGVDLPHDYSIDQEFTTAGEAESGFLPGGIGWYRKTFVVPKKYQDKQLIIEFDGAYMNAEVYLNGKKLGSHPYGYTGFAFDITDGLIYDGVTENVIAVKTNNAIPSSRWYSGSGIYRDVKLTITDKVHVGYNGTQVVANDLENNYKGTVAVDVKAKIENDSDSNKTVTVKNTLLDKQGKAVSNIASSNIDLAANSVQSVEQIVSVEKPKLWSVEDANMYTMKTEIIEGEKVLDTYETDYGFRYFAFDNNNGFSLNGENIKLKGVCMHHDQGALGAVANRDAIERQVKMLKEMGCNAIRVTHNPASSVLLEICNEYGMLVINEAFDGWTAYKNGNVNDYTAYFNQTITDDNQIINGRPGMKWGEFDSKAMVDGAKNEPSVIMWSIGNEVDEGVSGDVSNYVNVASDIIKWIQEIDTSRPVTNGDNRKNTNPSQLLSQINQKIYEAGGVVGMNYANNNQTNAMHNAYKDWPLYGSETASAVHSRGVYYTAGRDNNTLQMSEYDNDQAKVGWGHAASDAWEFVIKNDFNAGEFVWTGFDYIGEPTPWNGTGAGSVSGQGAKPKSSYFGIIDTAGFEKDTYYLYKSMWDESSTTLHLMSTWNNNEIVKDQNGKVKVDVYTNAAKVELYLNGKKIGEDKATKHTTSLGYTYQTFSNGEFYPSFNVQWASGTLMAKAYDEKGILISETEGRSSVTTSGAAAKLDAYSNKKEITADGSSLSYITVDVKDDKGNIVNSAANQIDFKIEGNGKIVGVDNGNAADTDSYKGNSRKAFSGKALVIVQSTKEAGSFTLTASSNGLTSAKVNVKTSLNDVAGEKYLQSYLISRNLYVGIKEKPVLPATVIGNYSTGDTKELTVTWDQYDASLLDKPGEFVITGKLQDSDAIVRVTVHVIGNVVALENYSTITNVGVVPNLPKTVKGIYENGTYSESFLIDWDIPEGAFDKEGIVTIKGNASVLETTKEVIATVRVAPKLTESQNIASKNYSDAPVFSNGTMGVDGPSEPSKKPINDSLLELNDGITNESNRESARWTNWDLRNANPPVDTYLQLEWKNEYTMQNIKLWHFVDNGYSRLPGDNNVRFEYFDSTTNTYKEIESSHITQVPFTSGDTPYGFINPVTTSKLRIWLKAPEVGKCIGLTEVEVYDYINPTAANDSANLDEIKLNDQLINEFNGYQGYDEATKTYTVDLGDNDYPQVKALANNNEAITILPVYNNVVKILVKSEDGQSINTYTIKYLTNVNKDDLNNYVNSQEIKDAIKNESSYTTASFNDFKNAYDNAITLLNDNSLTQKQIDDAYKALQDTYVKLEKVTVEIVDKTALTSVVEQASKISDDILSELDDAIVKEFKEALSEAKEILANDKATQEEVNNATDRLTKALESLVVENASKDQLQALVELVKGLNKDDYTNATWDILSNAVDRANQVLNDQDASKETIAKAIKELQEAIDNLEKAAANVPSNKPSDSSKPANGAKTGDDFNLYSNVAILGLSLLAVFGVLRKRKSY